MPPTWMNSLQSLCAKFNVEPVVAEETETYGIKKINFNCPRDLTGEETAAIIRALPHTVESQFTTAPKKFTIEMLTLTLRMLGIKVDAFDYTEARELEVKAHAEGSMRVVSNTSLNGKELKITDVFDASNKMWTDLAYALKADGAIDSWKFLCDTLDISKDVKHLPEREDPFHFDPREYLSGTAKKLIEEAMQQREQEVDGIPHTEQPFDSEPVDSRPVPRVTPSKKPARDICPTSDEITNLSIDLANAQSVDDIIAMM